MAEFEGGLFRLGYDAAIVGQPPAVDGRSFAFDNEKPAHQVFLQDFALDRAPVSNGDFLAFINDGGYQNFRWWFSEGWEAVNREQWRAPLYWEQHDGRWLIRDFAGLHAAASKSKRTCLSCQLFRSFCVCEMGRQTFADGSRVGKGCDLQR